MSDSVRPHRRQPTRFPHPWESPGKNTGVGCHFLLQCMKVKIEREVAQSCLTLRDAMDGSPPGSSVRGIFQARGLEWVPLSSTTHKIDKQAERPAATLSVEFRRWFQGTWLSMYHILQTITSVPWEPFFRGGDQSLKGVCWKKFPNLPSTSVTASPLSTFRLQFELLCCTSRGRVLRAREAVCTGGGRNKRGLCAAFLSSLL